MTLNVTAYCAWVGGIEPALRAAAPSGVSVSVTGFEQIQAVGGSAGGGGPSVLVGR